MKSLTEFSGVTIRAAAAALADARRSLPAERPPEVAVAEPSPAAAEGAPEQAAAPEQPSASPADGGEAPQAASAPDASAETDAVRAALDEAVAKATGLSGDRLGMLRAAVEAAGTRTADVRTIRVFGPEEPVGGARSIGGRQYLVDYLPHSMKQVTAAKKDERGRGGRGRGGGGGGRGGGAGRGGAGAGTTGGFSMDSLRDDRKNERGARRPGGAPGGGRPKK